MNVECNKAHSGMWKREYYIYSNTKIYSVKYWMDINQNVDKQMDDGTGNMITG